MLAIVNWVLRDKIFYELGFIPPAIDGKRHELRVELTKEAKAGHKGLRLRYRPEYIPVRKEPEWAQ